MFCKSHRSLALRLSLVLSFASTLSLATSTLAAQDDPPDFEAAEAALTKKSVQILLRQAGIARSKKFGQKEKEAYQLILSHYDKDHARSRRALDFAKMKTGGWRLVAPKKRKVWVDKANRKGRFEVQKAERKARLDLSAQHRSLGLAMLKAGGSFTARAKAHLGRAIFYNPLDSESHLALEHLPAKVGDLTYYGTAEQVAFIRRMKEMETFALTLAKRTYNPQPITSIPDVLAKTGLQFAGAKTKNFKVFVRGTQENADDVVQWGERALEFFDYVVGDEHDQLRQMARLHMATWDWIGIVWTKPEMDDFKAKNPQLLRDRKGKYNNVNFTTGSGKHRKVSQVTAINMPSYMHDFLIAHVFHYGLGGTRHNNVGLLEGVHHAATWFLKSTCFAKFSSEPKGTVTNMKRSLPEGANWWLREMRNQAIAGTDTPLNVVPRTELYKFGPDARLKTWSFGVWAMARFPGKWVEFPQGLPLDRIPLPDTVDKVGAEIFGMSLKQVEDEWREWAAGRCVSAAATGYGPPLLPEFPNKDELEGLERLNAVRAATTCWPEAGGKPPEDGSGGTTSRTPIKLKQWNKCLPLCELDSEATAACKDHARFFGKHEEHWRWPEAHEEDPAKEGFTPRGMRAGLRSVIVWSTGELDSSNAIDQWIGTVYHRFPLLEYNIKRFGIAYDNAGKAEVIVLDMGSLQEPREDYLERSCAYVAWPPDKMKNVPRQFAYTEHPNPLADVGLDFAAQQKTGYPVSLQFTRLIMNNVAGVSMKLYEGKKRGGKMEHGTEIPCWLHTPDKPLLKRMVMRNVVFVIPKAVLRAGQTYAAEVTVKGRPPFKWSFTTGSRLQGLGRLK